MTATYRLRRYNQKRLRQLIAGNHDITVFSAHDPSELPPQRAASAP
jgi:hypothetical protein